ncbi:sulfate/molybdate ABC transporter ATP-binding protein [Microbacterium thalli]|uniref:ABC transporter ATP-binding protein n=1 Tax=Microbacterium thalli TaxID=3027921 RepID=A0ABT5SFW1_9MICO|nr:ABC transporter ATP-binding protein [Microbacterium thalli]MDD7929075.1 ABC transporter ATP-binding protein [Microbacterium thalli]MDD7961660.1 ABC transporter ATP-binding protein [Microbacterium thalli]
MTAALAADIRVRRRGLTVAAALTAAPGEIVAVMGPSGAGKTTVLEAIAGLTPLDAGSVRIGDEVVSAPGRQVAPQRRGTVLLRQDPCLFPHLSARDNVAFGLRSRGETARRSRAVAEDWLARVGLAGAEERAPRELSGGQQQRVALARALAAEPRVVLLDEPLTALDPATAATLRTVLADQLRAAGTTALLVTHDALDAAAAADRLVLLEEGRVSQAGDVRSVLRAPATPFGAAIAGLNRVVGRVDGGVWRAGALRIAERADAGDASIALFRPGAVGLAAGDGGIGRLADALTWEATVDRLEPTVGGVRVFVADPALAVDVSVEHAAELRPGRPVVLELAASDITWA